MADGAPRSFIYAGSAPWASDSAGQSRGGLFRRAVGDAHWEPLRRGLPEPAEVRAIAVHPVDSSVVYVGTQDGPYRSTDRGEHWERLNFPDAAPVVWSILVHPRDPRTLYLGTAPAAVYRSDDGGDAWHRLPEVRPLERVQTPFPTRVTRLAADTNRPDEIYAALEVGGVMRSADGGVSWTDCSQDLVKLAERAHLKSRIVSDTDTEGMLDAHALCLSSARPGTVFLALRMGLFQSVDRGSTWEDMEIGRFSPLTYARDVQVAPHDARVLYACLSPAARSEDGALYRSDDLGTTWNRLDRDVTARSTMMAVALHHHDRAQVYCVTRSGQVFGTQDGGRSWHEYPLPAGIGDVYAVACG